MQILQINSINTQIQLFDKLKMEELFAQSYPDQTELENIQIGRMKIGEFINLSKRVVLQLDKEIKTDNVLILPTNFSSPELGQSSIGEIMTNFVSQISARQFPNAENSLLWLALYQMQNGFFDKSKLKIHSIESLELKKSNDELLVISENYKQLKNQYSELLTELKAQKISVSEFLTQKQNELQQISNNLTSANTNNTQIQSLLNSSTQSETKITSSLEQIEKEKKKAEEITTTLDASFTQFKSDFSELIKKLNTTDTDFQILFKDFEVKYLFVESKHKYFEDRNIYLDNLIGREVGASLFETFQQRKLELTEPLKWWRIAIGIMASLTFIFILAIFTNFFGLFGTIPTSFTWENIVVNAVKSSPFVFLLYYCIAQYNKERNFQEEYAFKSASALTIKAYSDILKDDKNKDELVLKAVFNIFRSPIYNKMNSTKDVNSALDLVSGIVNKGSEILTKK
jgi:hypothetical protein